MTKEKESINKLIKSVLSWKEKDKDNRHLFVMASSRKEGTDKFEGFVCLDDKDIDSVHDMMINSFKQKRNAAVVAVSAVLNSHPELIVSAYKDAVKMCEKSKDNKPLC